MPNKGSRKPNCYMGHPLPIDEAKRRRGCRQCELDRQRLRYRKAKKTPGRTGGFEVVAT